MAVRLGALRRFFAAIILSVHAAMQYAGAPVSDATVSANRMMH
jgi:hypothetical protein